MLSRTRKSGIHIVRNYRLWSQMHLFNISPFFVWAIHSSWIISGVAVGFVIVVKLTGTLLYGGEYPDPFVAYDSLLPGQPAATLQEHCPMFPNRINGEIIQEHLTCVLIPTNETFASILLDIWNNRITSVTFYVRNVTLGEVLLHWKAAGNMQRMSGSIRWFSNDYCIEAIGHDLKYPTQVQMIWVTTGGNTGCNIKGGY